MSRETPRGMKLAMTIKINRLDDAGQPTGFVEFPNPVTVTLAPSVEAIDIISNGMDNQGAVLDSYNEASPTVLSISTNQIDHRETLAHLLMGTDSTLARTAASVVMESAQPIPGRMTELANNNIKGDSVVATRPAYAVAPATGDTLAYFYKTGGTAPTITITDPAAADQSLSISVSTEDVTISLATNSGSNITTTYTELVAALNASAANTLVMAVLPPNDDGATIAAARAQAALANGGTQTVATDAVLGLLDWPDATIPVPHSIAYDYHDKRGYAIDGSTKNVFKGRILARSINRVNGQYVLLDAYRVNLAPNGDIEILGGNAAAVGAWKGSMETPEGYTSPYKIERFTASV